MENEQIIRQVAAELGVEAAIALAFAEAESSGRMVYGHDTGGVHSTRDGAITIDGTTWPKGSNIPVTDASFRELERRVAAGERSNGVGIMQITYKGFFPDARAKGLDLADPADNLRYGLTLIRGYLRAAPADVDPLAYAASRYNRGHWAGPYHYTDRVARLVQAWRDKEAPMSTYRGETIAITHSTQENPVTGVPGIRWEEQLTEPVAERAAAQLRALGYKVRTDAPHTSAGAVADWANAVGAAMIIDIHTDATGAQPNTRTRGTSVFHHPNSSGGKQLANILYRRVGAIGGVRRTIGPHAKNLAVIYRTKGIANLVELEFHDRADTARLVWDRRDDYGDAVALSVLEYYSDPRPLPTQPKEDPLMSLSTADQTLLVEAAKRIMGVTPSPDIKDPATGSHATLLDKADGHYIVGQIAANGQASAQIAGELAGLREALKLAATDEEALDLDLIAAAAKAGAEQALTAAHGPLLAAIEDLTAAVDLLDAGAVTQQLSDALARVRVHLIEES